MGPVVLDTNVLVSALLFRGQASRLREYWREKVFRMVVSADTLGELVRVLRYPKFKLPEGMAEALVATEVMPFCDLVVPDPSPPACRDADDDKFLWCARDGAAEALITGDPDLLALGTSWSGVTIKTLAEFLGELDHLL